MIDFDSLLVPVDFSPISAAMVDQAVQLASGDEPLVILLHVLDTNLAEFAVSHGLGDRERVLSTMKHQADAALAQHKQKFLSDPQRKTAVDMQTIVVEGIPFLEILRKSEEFQVGAILLGKQSNRGGIERLLFGSTAEHVIRGSRRPVIVLPIESQEPPAVTPVSEDHPSAEDVGG